MRANHQVRLASAYAFERGRLFSRFQTTDKQFDTITSAFEDASCRQEMLDCKNFSGRHKSGLAPIFNGKYRRLQCNDCFAATDIALQQTIHRHWLLKVGGDLAE